MAQDQFTGDGRFPATRWSVLEAARSGDREERTRALDKLCEAYWKPVYKYVRLRWDKAARRQKRGGEVPHLALDFSGAEEELGGSTIDPAAIASPESLEAFFEKEWLRSLFAVAVEDLRMLCVERGRDRAFRLFEAYDLEGDDQASYEFLAEKNEIAVSEVTNSLAWVRREFRRIALERLREICASEDEFERESKAAFGWEIR